MTVVLWILVGAVGLLLFVNFALLVTVIRLSSRVAVMEARQEQLTSYNLELLQLLGKHRPPQD